MPPAPLPIEVLPDWARLNGVNFLNVELQHLDDKGLGLVATQRLSLSADHEGAIDDAPLVKVPRDLALSGAAVDEYAKVDHNFRQLLDAMGHQSSRVHILLYLLAHLASSKQDRAGGEGAVPTPWTEYAKFLPREILVPTLWSESERDLLQGTSLEAAVDAKLSSLHSELDELRTKSSELPFWNALFWEQDTVTLEDWALVDAWYRSRCLDLPTVGESMVPIIDMANHSNEPDAYYDEDSDGDVEILLRPGFTVPSGNEVTISYGEFKSAAEMLFTYGFIDRNASTDEMKLWLDSLPDDPLMQAKLHIFEQFPTVRLSRTEGRVRWDCPYVHLMVLNEEDGLEFRVLQDTDGGRQLKVFWQGEDATDQAANFETLIQDHPLSPLFRLRAVIVLAGQLTARLGRIQNTPISEQPEGTQLREACIQAAGVLKDIEISLLEATLAALKEQETHLLADDAVKAYLGSTEDSQNEQDSTEGTNEEDDFS